MNMIDIISKKRDNKVLTQPEINYWIKEMVNESIPDYQSSALLMAIVLNGLNDQETSDLTIAMKDSGDVIDLSNVQGKTSDKHSTGGVGDKTSLVIAPLVAACGGKVAKMSGKGLGHTGGTIDKLASIEGLSTMLDNDQFIKQVNEINLAIIEQTKNLVPADKILYGLRDVTATVSSIPLIASSIMSKKLAAGADTILLDVKYGDGAFMQTLDDAKALAKAMIAIGKKNQKDTRAMITSMDQPLGYSIGNALEVKEAIATLANEGPEDLKELCVEAASIMLVQGDLFEDVDTARNRVHEVLSNGEALAKLKAMIRAQGGNEAVVDRPNLLPKSKDRTALLSKNEGYISRIHAQQLGLSAMALGAGRRVKEDAINYGVGLILTVKVGDFVSKNDVICMIYHDEHLDDDFLSQLYDSFEFSMEKPASQPLIAAFLD